jgi:hypothetical protein
MVHVSYHVLTIWINEHVLDFLYRD